MLARKMVLQLAVQDIGQLTDIDTSATPPPGGGAGTRYYRMVSDTHSAAVPAGPLHLVQSLANTVGADRDADLLSTREEAAAWLHTAGLLPDEAGLTNSEHSALLRLRDSIRDILAAHTRGQPDAAAAGRLTRALADGRLVLTVDAASTVELASAARASYPNLVAAVAVAIAASAASGHWLRLRTCAVPDCGQAFHDESAGTRCPVHMAGR